MRKLKLQVQVSIDGFIAGPNGEMDWLLMDWSQDLKDFVTDLSKSMDTILLGKNLAMGFIPYWTQSYKSDAPEEGAEIFATTAKVVFSKTLTPSDPMLSSWENTRLANGDLVKEVTALKNTVGKDLIVYGGGKFVSALLKEQLIDELHLFINPTLLGKGMSIFKELNDKQNLKLINSKAFDCGIVVLSYQKI